MLDRVNDLELGPLHFGIVGAGRLGLAAGRALQDAGFEVVHVAAASDAGRERATSVLAVPAHEDSIAACLHVDCVLLCVPDDRLGEVVAHLATRPADASPMRLRFVSMSAAGLAPLAPLAELGHDVCVLHPVASFTSLDGDATPFHGAAAAIGADTDAASTFAHALAHALGLIPFDIAEAAWPAHAAACTAASAFVGSILELTSDLAASAGIQGSAARGAYGALAASAVSNFRATGVPSSSGAIARGDGAALRTQIRAVRQHASSFEEVFDAGTSAAINSAFTSGRIDIETARALSAAAGAAFTETIGGTE